MTSSRATYEENVSFFLVIIIPELLLRHRFQDQLGHCGLGRRLRIHPRLHHSNHRNFQRGSGSRDRHSFIVTLPRLSLCKLLPSRRCGICARQVRHARVFQRTQKPNSLSTGAALTKPALWRISNRLASTRLRGKSSFALLLSTLFSELALFAHFRQPLAFAQAQWRPRQCRSMSAADVFSNFVVWQEGLQQPSLSVLTR